MASFFLFLPKMKKLLCEDRFMGEEAELRDRQLLSQMLEAVRVTPSLHEDLQVEVMKVRAGVQTAACSGGTAHKNLLLRWELTCSTDSGH